MVPGWGGRIRCSNNGDWPQMYTGGSVVRRRGACAHQESGRMVSADSPPASCGSTHICKSWAQFSPILHTSPMGGSTVLIANWPVLAASHLSAWASYALATASHALARASCTDDWFPIGGVVYPPHLVGGETMRDATGRAPPRSPSARRVALRGLAQLAVAAAAQLCAALRTAAQPLRTRRVALRARRVPYPSGQVAHRHRHAPIGPRSGSLSFRPSYSTD